MKRHGFYTALLSGLLLCWVLIGTPVLAETSPLEAQRPNILLIVADDLGLGDLGSFNTASVAPTPNIDALAARGMRFSRFYTDSTCSASRASLLTGQSPARLGFHPVARGVAPDVTTLPDWLRAQGYSTHHVGKWHIGELNAEAKPAAQGFDTSFGFLNQWFLQGPDANGKPVLRQPVYLNPWLENERGEWQQYSGYLPNILTQRAVENITGFANGKQPWFMWYATPLPHGPLHVPPGLIMENASDADKYSDKDKYTAMIRHLDSNVGEILSALENSGQRNNTIIVFLSDNGAPEKNNGSNAGFAGGKAHYSEGAVRTPMIWVDDNQIMPASLDERAITIADIFPTLAARIGAPLSFDTDGVDFNNLTSVKIINERPLYWMSRGSASILSADKLWRTVEEWVFRERQAFNLWRIHADHVNNKSSWRYWYYSMVSGMQKDFVAWLDDVSRTQVKQESLADGIKITGNDFLRTPLKEWDFYIAVSLQNSADTELVLAEQKNIWSLRYDMKQQQFVIGMHGHQWQVPFAMPEGCVMVGLNADIYDRYTNVGNTVNPTELLLSVNGKEVARTEWQIDSLADIKIAEPTWLVKSAKPVFYHRANMVGEWPYMVDELALQQELCNQP